MEKRIGNITISSPNFRSGTLGQGTRVIIADTADEKLPFALGIVTENMGHKLRITVIDKNGSFLREGEVWYQSEEEEATILLPVMETRFDQIGGHYPFMKDGQIYERTESSVGMTLIDENMRVRFEEWETVYAIKREHLKKN
jgi:hypothetical protein